MEENKEQENQTKIIGENARKVLEIIEENNKKQEKNKDDGEER